jgi:hypothetical protein
MLNKLVSLCLIALAVGCTGQVTDSPAGSDAEYLAETTFLDDGVAATDVFLAGELVGQVSWHIVDGFADLEVVGQDESLRIEIGSEFLTPSEATLDDISIDTVGHVLESAEVATPSEVGAATQAGLYRPAYCYSQIFIPLARGMVYISFSKVGAYSTAECQSLCNGCYAPSAYVTNTTYGSTTYGSCRCIGWGY